jgi:hypothetical protein
MYKWINEEQKEKEKSYYLKEIIMNKPSQYHSVLKKNKI